MALFMHLHYTCWTYAILLSIMGVRFICISGVLNSIRHSTIQLYNLKLFDTFIFIHRFQPSSIKTSVIMKRKKKSYKNWNGKIDGCCQCISFLHALQTVIGYGALVSHLEWILSKIANIRPTISKWAFVCLHHKPSAVKNNYSQNNTRKWSYRHVVIFACDDACVLIVHGCLKMFGSSD